MSYAREGMASSLPGVLYPRHQRNTTCCNFSPFRLSILLSHTSKDRV